MNENLWQPWEETECWEEMEHRLAANKGVSNWKMMGNQFYTVRLFDRGGGDCRGTLLLGRNPPSVYQLFLWRETAFSEVDWVVRLTTVRVVCVCYFLQRYFIHEFWFFFKKSTLNLFKKGSRLYHQDSIQRLLFLHVPFYFDNRSSGGFHCAVLYKAGNC